MTTLEHRLFVAISTGSLTEVGTALKEGARLDVRNEDGRTPLHAAAAQAKLDIVRALLDGGADPNARLCGGDPNAKGRTPLHEAAWTADAGVVSLLLQRGANPFARAAHDLTPVGFAEMRGKRAATNMRKAIATSPIASELNLPSSVRAGLVARAGALLDAGTPVDTIDDGGRTALHHAVMSGQEALVRLLIERGADVNAKDRGGCYPLMRLQDTPEIARLLLAAGADPNAEWGEGSTVFHYLAAFRSAGVLQVLLEFGADLTLTSADGRGVREYMKTNTPRARAFLKDRLGSEPTPANAAIAVARAEIKRLPELATEATFTRLAAQLGTIFDRRPSPWKKRKGAVCFHNVSVNKYLAPFYGEAPASPADASAQLFRLLARLQDDVRAQGFGLVYIGAFPDAEGRIPLILLPTREKYVPLLLNGTSGINYGHSAEAIVSWLFAVESANPFVVDGCGPDFVDGRFTGEVEDAESLAERMITFCPDVTDQASSSLSQLPRDRQILTLARELEATRTFALWWD